MGRIVNKIYKPLGRRTKIKKRETQITNTSKEIGGHRYRPVKIKENLTKLGLGGQKGSCTHSMSITGWDTERCTLHHLLQETIFASQLMRNYHHPELMLFSNELSFETTPLPTSFPLLHETTFLSCVFVGCVYSFAIACMPQIAILCYSQINPLLQVKY